MSPEITHTIEKIRALGYKWYIKSLNGYPRVRTNIDGHDTCPLAALAGEKGTYVPFNLVNLHVRASIIDAADFTCLLKRGEVEHKLFDVDVRAALEALCE